MKELSIPVFSSGQMDWNNSAFVEIEHYPWESNGYRPKTVCYVFATHDRLHLKFESFEKNIRMEVVESGSEVCQDSCVEFFFQPTPRSDNRYINFELNPIGALCLGIGTDRNNWSLMDLKEGQDLFQIETSILPSKWIVTFQIPFSFIKALFPDFVFHHGIKMRGNFYKCGDLTVYPHFGCWNRVDNPAPDFHLTPYFGQLCFG